MTDAKFRENKLHDIAHFGLRAAIGTVFILHSLGKFDSGFVGFLNQIGIPAEMQFLIAFAELISGTLLIIGILTRISASILSIILLGVIFHVKHAAKLTGQGGFELELVLLAGVLTIIVAGPGRLSISQLIKKIPRFLQ
ncbi:MAG TPA: DoxX family protein [Nitrosopumilaceae archaeon]|nr:DoxX family protein [Nitrosopumilaceae archaeon]